MTQSLQRSLFSGLFWILLLNLIVKPFWILGIDVGVQNAVGAESYGLYFTLFNIAYIFNILLDVGITNFNTRNIAQHPQLLRKHLASILTIKLLLLIGYLLITLSVGLLLGYTSKQFWLLLLLCFNQFLNSLILYLRSNFEGLLLFRWDGLFSVLDRMLMIAICGGLLMLSHQSDVSFRIEWFVYAQTSAYFLTAAAAFVVLLRRTGLQRLQWNRPFTIMILRQSAPFALLVLLMASYNRIDPILLSSIAPNGNTEAGIYASAFRLLDALTMIAYLVSVPLLPIFARLTRRKADAKYDDLASITQSTFSLIMVFAIAAAITFAFLCQPLMELLYRDHIEASAKVFRILIYGIIPISFTYIFGTLLTAGGHLRRLNILALSTLCLNIAINLILIPQYGALGCAWASLGAQSFMAIAQTVIAARIYKIRPTMTYISKLVAFTLLIWLGNLACRQWANEWWLQMTAMILVAILTAVLLRLIDLKVFRQFLSERQT